MGKTSLPICTLLLTLVLSSCSVFSPSLSSASNPEQWQTYNIDLSKQLDALVFTPASPTEKGLVFYPGGKVEPEAYGGLANRLTLATQRTVVITPMPLDLAILKGKAGQTIQKRMPQINQWVIAGHSLGGVVASGQAYQAENNWQGLILLASYPLAKHDYTASGFPILTVIGTKDTVVNAESWAESSKLLSSNAVILEIEGGNHAGFGEYGPQPDDSPATITPAQQQQLTVEAIEQWLASSGL